MIDLLKFVVDVTVLVCLLTFGVWIKNWILEGRAKLDRIITIVMEIQEGERNDPNQ